MPTYRRPHSAERVQNTQDWISLYREVREELEDIPIMELWRSYQSLCEEVRNTDSRYLKGKRAVYKATLAQRLALHRGEKEVELLDIIKTQTPDERNSSPEVFDNRKIGYEPNLFAAVAETERHKGMIFGKTEIVRNEIIREQGLSDQIIGAVGESHLFGLLLLGSDSWAENYDIREYVDEMYPGSDLDFDIIVDNDLSTIENLADAEFVENEYRAELLQCLQNFKQLYNLGQADHMSYKLKYQGRDISIHVTPRSTLDLVCSYDPFESEGEETLYVKEYRIKPKQKPPQYKFGSFDSSSLEHVVDIQRLDETPIDGVSIEEGQMKHQLMVCL